MADERDAARTWFGYGRWKAPYWFIGIEPGETDNAASYVSWKRLGGGELIDCREHHVDSDFFHCMEMAERGRSQLGGD